MGEAYLWIIFITYFVRLRTEIRFGFITFENAFASLIFYNIIAHYEQLAFSEAFY